MIPIEKMRYNAHFIKVALDGYLALPESGGELCDKRDYLDNDKIVLFEKNAVKKIIKDLSVELVKLSDELYTT